jgi:hypothetical protein
LGLNTIKTSTLKIAFFQRGIRELWVREGNRKRPLVGAAMAGYVFNLLKEFVD